MLFPFFAFTSIFQMKEAQDKKTLHSRRWATSNFHLLPHISDVHLQHNKICFWKNIRHTFPGNMRVFLSTRKLSVEKERSLVPQSFEELDFFLIGKQNQKAEEASPYPGKKNMNRQRN